MPENTILQEGEILKNFVESFLSTFPQKIFHDCNVQIKVSPGFCKVTICDHKGREILASSDKNIQGCGKQIGSKFRSFITFIESASPSVDTKPLAEMVEEKSISNLSLPKNVLQFPGSSKQVSSSQGDPEKDNQRCLECIEEVYCGFLDILLGTFGGLDIEEVGIKYRGSTAHSTSQGSTATLSLFDQVTGKTLLSISTESFYYSAKLLFLRLAGKLNKPPEVKTKQLADLEEHNALNVVTWWRMAWRIIQQLSEDEILALRSETYGAEMKRILQTDEKCVEWSMWKQTPIPG